MLTLRPLAALHAFALGVLALLLVFPAVARAEGVLYVAKDATAEPRVFPLAKTEVKAEVSGDIVSTWVTQRFQNPFNERIEAVYVFPLPNHAAVDAMEMRIGKRTVKADVKRRAEAQATYDAAARRGQHAALLEQERPNIFTFSVANVDPGGEIEVKLHFFELAKYEKGTYEMVFPTVVGPRYIPGRALPGANQGTGTRRDTDRVTDASRISPPYVPPATRSGHAIAISVHLDAGAPIEAIESPAHEIDASQASASVRDVKLRDKAEIANRDFVFRWRLAAPELRAAAFSFKSDKDGYVALLVEPKHDPQPADIAPRELVFLLDTSGSMRGAPLATATAACNRALSSMNPSDTFQIIDFADTASAFAPQPLPNNPENVRRAREYLAHLQGSGGTNQLAGIHAALSAKGDERRLRYVVFMTDGYIGNEREVIQLVSREIGGARIFGFGIGSSVNRFLLDEVSLVGRGASEYLRPNEESHELVERFYERIAQPYLTDIQLDWGTLKVTDTLPGRIPDLHASQPLVVFGRYEVSGVGTVTIRGRLGGRAFEQKLEVKLPDAPGGNVAIGRVWAREKIAQLSREEKQAGSREQEITKVALEHHLVSQYTSLVAVDDAPDQRRTNAFPLLVTQPSESPEGVDLASAGGQYANAPAPPSEMDVRMSGTSVQESESVHRSGGCAGCTVGAHASATSDAIKALGAALAFLLVLARRRKKEKLA
jgi:Ca-activated chloride channel family protein